MTGTNIRTLTVGVALSVVDAAATRHAAFLSLVKSGDAAAHDGGSIAGTDDALKVLCAPWRMVDGAEAVSVEVRREDGDHLVVATFAVEDAVMAAASASGLLAGRGIASTGVLGDDVLALLRGNLAATGVEVQDGYADEDEAEADFDVDVVLEAARMLGDEEPVRLAA